MREVLPLLFECSRDRDAYIDSFLVRASGGVAREWNLLFHRDFNDWEVDDVLSFFHILHSNIPEREGEDGAHWCLKKNGVFDTRSFYLALHGTSGVVFPWKGI